MKSTEEILIQQNREMIQLLTEIKETNRQMRNHLIYHCDFPQKANRLMEVVKHSKSHDNLKSILKRTEDDS